MRNVPIRWWLYPITLICLLLITTPTQAQTDDESAIPPPQTVTIAGTLQPQLGCAGEWMPECQESMLTYDAVNDLYTATFTLTAGDYEYKAALNGSWDDNYGLNAEYYGPNIPLTVPEDGPVTFFYDHKTRWVSDSLNSLIAAVPGSYQPTVGCADEWMPDCLRSLLQDSDGDGRYTFVTALIPPGDYEAKVALNQAWTENYGADGVADGDNISFTVPENAQVTFTYDPDTHILTIETAAAPPDAITTLDAASVPAIISLPPPAAPMPDLVVVPGTIQSGLGCSGDWQPDCENTALTFDDTNQLWRATFAIAAGDYEYKVALNGSWDVNFGLDAQQDGPNIPLSLAQETSVTFYFDHRTGWITDDVNSLIANVPGDYQSEIGCPEDWQPACLRSWLQDPDGDGIFIFQTVDIPAGDYEAKVAVGQTWGVNYGEGGAPDGPNIPFSVPADKTLVTFAWDANSHLLTIGVGDAGGPVIPGNLKQAQAHWLTADTIAWEIDPSQATTFQLHYSLTGGTLALTANGIQGGDALPLTVDENGLSDEVLAKFPHLSGFTTLKLSPDALSQIKIILKGPAAVSASDETGTLLDSTSLQIPGVLDDLFTYNGPLGLTYEGDVPTLRLWAPTARSVRFHLFNDANPLIPAREVQPMRIDPDTGVWSITGTPEWNGRYYLYEVEVYTPATNSVVTNLVTDPYAVSLSMNSQRSQIIDLTAADYKPDGWDEMAKPPLQAPEDITIYELHLRDFSVNDPTVPPEHQGTYLAFTDTNSSGMQHLIHLAQAGLTHLHLLPTFDITTINENKAEWVEPDPAELAALAADSDAQQALIAPIRDEDGFNWGYDPFHYTVPEGSYATDANGPTRILEYRQMVQSLNENGLRVVMDVVYNHTSSSGQADTAVLDRIVPGYYHRLNATGKVETSTCCQNTATEHNMMRKLMVDSIITWATQYKIDAFRFDLMGHHMAADMQAVRDALDSLTVATDGVDGASIYLYGEGWNFGEVADNQRGINATQANMAGTGIGTFNDRLRDAVRGGNPFGGQTEQGFINGLYYDPNDTDQGPETAQLDRLLRFADQIRVGLAGNLADYTFIDQTGNSVAGREIAYNDQAAGYTLDPQENIVYISKHDNETLFDIIQFKAPLDSTLDERVRMQNMGLSLVSLSQGVPFFQAGSDMLRSKSMDRNSYNSGDWFNRLDFSYQSNNWAVGLPPAADNSEMWPVIQSRLAAAGLTPTSAHILQAVAHFQEMLQIRHSSPLFRLQTAEQVQDRLTFHNTGPDQVPGLIVMSLSDMDGRDNIDPNYGLIVTLFNANDEDQTFTIDAFQELPLTLHPVQAASSDPVVQTAVFAADTGVFTIPARTTAVFVLAEADAPASDGGNPLLPWFIGGGLLLAGLAGYGVMRRRRSA